MMMMLKSRIVNIFELQHTGIQLQEYLYTQIPLSLDFFKHCSFQLYTKWKLFHWHLLVAGFDSQAGQMTCFLTCLLLTLVVKEQMGQCSTWRCE